MLLIIMKKKTISCTNFFHVDNSMTIKFKSAVFDALMSLYH
jgi:hypothetical protein